MLWLVEPVPNTRFLQGNPADPGHKQQLQQDGRERGRLHAPGCCFFQLALPQSAVQKSSSHAVGLRRASERWEEAGKAVWVGRLHSVLRPPFQPKAHSTSNLRENGDTGLSSKVWMREASR